MTKHREKTWIFQQAIRYRTPAPRRRAVSKQRRHLPLRPSVLWTRSDSKVKEGRAPPRTAPPETQDGLTVEWRWREVVGSPVTGPEQSHVPVSGSARRSGKWKRQADWTGHLWTRLLQHCRQTWRLGSERRTGGPDRNVIGRFKRGYWRNVGQREEFGIGNENGSDSAIHTDTTSQTRPVHE